jgi:hypothetical protein
MGTKEKTYADCVAGAEGCTYIRFDFPVVTEAPPGTNVDAITGVIESFLLRPLREDAEPQGPARLMESFLEDFRAFREKEPRSAQYWFLERKAFVLNNRPNVLSLSLKENASLGGAQGITTFQFVNLDPRTGEPILLEDLLREGALGELMVLAEARFREVRRIEPDASLAAAGFDFPSGAFELTPNFAIGVEGLTFYYNPYDIGAYALGPSEIVLGYDEIEDLLDPEFLSDPPA